MHFKSFSAQQLTALTWWCDSSPYRSREAIICDGAVRSGKTLCMSISFVCWAMRRFDGAAFGLCGKTITSLRRNIVSVLLSVLRELGFSCEEKISQNRITVHYAGRSNVFYLFGGRDEASASLIQGVTLAGVLLDEVALMPRSFVEQACARCSVEGSKLWFNCNPESPGHWFYQEWIRKTEEKHALYLHFIMEDNPSLSRRTIERYKRLYSGVFFRRFVLGEWVTASGLIYDFFDESFPVPVPEGEFERYVVSCDYGTANPSSFGLWAKRGEVWYRISEYYYDSRKNGRQKTDAEYVQDLKALIGGRKILAVVADPSAASFITALSRENFPVVRAENEVLSGIRITADLLKNGKIKICDTCRDLLREMQLYRWDEAALGRDVPVKENDHAMDDMRYFAVTVASRSEALGVARSVDRGRRAGSFPLREKGGMM